MKTTPTNWALIFITLVLIIAFFPLAIIWALNTLFSLGIAYGFSQWLATFLLLSVFNVNQVRNNK
jgi:uncharacterized membrane protein (DUF485 family)